MTHKSRMLAALLALLSFTALHATQRRAPRQRGTQAKIQPTPTPAATPVPTPQEATLSLDAGVVFKSGDVKPVARTDFFLYDEHPGIILKAAGIQPKDVPQKVEKPDELVFYWSLARRTSIVDDSAEFLRVAEPALKPHLIQSVTTDFSGKAQFGPIKPGVYYLYGLAEFGKTWLVWNMKLDIQSKQYSLTLDNKNAAFIWPLY